LEVAVGDASATRARVSVVDRQTSVAEYNGCRSAASYRSARHCELATVFAFNVTSTAALGIWLQASSAILVSDGTQF